MSWHPTLDDMERKPDGPHGHGPPRSRDNREPSTRGTVLSSGTGCWCGAHYGHGWEGKADGAPHPRDWPGRVSGHPCRSAP